MPGLPQAQQPPQGRRALRSDQGLEASPDATGGHLVDATDGPLADAGSHMCALAAQWSYFLRFTDKEPEDHGS